MFFKTSSRGLGLYTRVLLSVRGGVLSHPPGQKKRSTSTHTAKPSSQMQHAEGKIQVHLANPGSCDGGESPFCLDGRHVWILTSRRRHANALPMLGMLAFGAQTHFASADAADFRSWSPSSQYRLRCGKWSNFSSPFGQTVDVFADVRPLGLQAAHRFETSLCL